MGRLGFPNRVLRTRFDRVAFNDWGASRPGLFPSMAVKSKPPALRVVVNSDYVLDRIPSYEKLGFVSIGKLHYFVVAADLARAEHSTGSHHFADRAIAARPLNLTMSLEVLLYVLWNSNSSTFQ